MRAALLLFGLAAGWAAAANVLGARPEITVGAAVPLTGLYADEGRAYRQGLLVWQDEVNAGPGLLGRRVALRLLDDRSDSFAAADLYRRLIGAEGAQLLVGPYGSAAVIGAAAVAERARRVMIDATGATHSAHRHAYRYVFQLATPYARYGLGLLPVLRAQKLTSLLVVAARDPASREAAARLREAARAAGVATGEIASVNSGESDFAPHVARARAEGAQAWVAFCAVREAAGMVKTFKRLNYTPALFFASAASQPEFVRLLGRDAEGALGLAPYAVSYAGGGNPDFVRRYRARWVTPPVLAAAQGYAAGKLLEAAVRRAGSLDPERLRAALAALEIETPLGRYKVDPASGAQIGQTAALTQIQAGEPTIVWPPAVAAAAWRLPYPSWAERKPPPGEQFDQ